MVLHATKRAAALAAEHDLDLDDIEGTGKDGKVTVDDVRAAVRALNAETALDSRERRVFNEVRAELEERELWRPIFAELAANYARAVVGAADARARIEREGTTTTGSQGQLVVHPEVKIRRDYELDVLKYAQALLITPEALQRHTEQGGAEEDDLGF